MTPAPDLPLRLLQLLHPSGAASHVVVVGSSTPTIPSLQVSDDHVRPIDLLVLAPSDEQSRSSEWRALASAASARLGEGGVVYLIATRRVRRRVLRLLGSELRVARRFAHIRERGRTRYLVEINPESLAYALSRDMGGGSRVLRAIAPQLRRFHLHRPFALFVPALGVALQRASTPPVLSWVLEIDDAREGGTILMDRTESHRNRLVVYRVGGNTPLVAKVADLGEELEREAATLDQFGAAAQRAGAIVPVRLTPARTTLRPLLVQTLVAGTAASDVVAGHPRRALRVLEMLARWLVLWNQSTAAPRLLTRADVDEALIEPARILEADLGVDYRRWLDGKAREWIGLSMPAVAAHLDLTMSNVLLDRDGRLGIIDWETARSDALPLVDFVYAAADAVAAVDNYASRPDAFRSAFVRGGRFYPPLHARLLQVARSLRVADPGIELCFHACWLHHAANEAKSAETTAVAPFREIASVVASRRPFLDS